MATRRVHLRGAAIQVEYPDGFVRRRLAGLRNRDRRAVHDGSRLQVLPAPHVSLQPRSPRDMLVSLGLPDCGEPGEPPPAGLATAVEAAHAAAAVDGSPAERVAACLWYHTIELPGGLITPGLYDHRPLLPHYGLPDDLAGARVLDVGTFDGFWAFEFERRGADVVALDLRDPLQLDLPRPAGELARSRSLDLPWARGFATAHDLLGSKVERVEGSVYELDPSVHGTFDLVHLGDVLLHLKSPVLALERIRSVTKGRFILADVVRGPDTADLRTVEYVGGWDRIVWWMPTFGALMQMVHDVGFAKVEARMMYRLPNKNAATGFWRVVVHATP